MTDFTRYAVYFAPEAGPFATLGASWLGWDMDLGDFVDHPDVPNIPIAAITQTPRKYGFHGTIKPPFRLALGTNFDALSQALDDLCANLPPLMMNGMRPAKIGSFLALVVDGDQSELSTLAFSVVTGLDRFRAPATDAEQEKRRAANLTPRQDVLLEKWGYPYVGDEFKFHMTLSGRLSDDDITTTYAAAASLFDPVLPAPFVVRDLCLVGEDKDGQFHLIRRVPLGG